MIAFFKDLVEQERKTGIYIEKHAEMLESVGSTGGSGHYNWEMLGVPPRVKTYVWAQTGISADEHTGIPTRRPRHRQGG